MSATDLLERPRVADRPVPNVAEDVPVFLDPSGQRQRLLEHALVAVLVAALLFLGMACYALV